MTSIIDSLKQFLRKRISSPTPNIWQRLFLFRKLYIIKFFRVCYSQFGEDLVLRDSIPKSIKKGFYVDVGCYHPRKYSNTYVLYKRGWRGINVDLDGLKIAGFNIARPEDCNITAGVSDREETMKVFSFGTYSLVSTLDETTATKEMDQVKGIRKIQTRTLNDIIESTRFAGQQIDLLSIDAEGHDLNVLKSLDIEKYRPRIIIIETHLAGLDQVEKSELYLYVRQKGYHLMNWVGFSLIFTILDNPLIAPNRRVTSSASS